MGTAEDVLRIERSYLSAGMKEVPNGSNRVPGLTDQPGYFPGAWCSMFQMHCLRKAGVRVGPGEYGSAWVSSVFDFYRWQGRCFTNARDAKPGDLVAFEWGSTAGGYDHVGIVESVRSDGLVTIEGNVSNKVLRLFRSWGSGLAEFARPAYTSSSMGGVDSGSSPGDLSAVYRQGSRGEFVKNIQKVVGVPADGVYGPQTESAVKVWQGKLGVVADGLWGPGTQKATDNFFHWLGSLDSKPATPAPAPAEDFFAAVSKAVKVVLRKGSRGDNVKFAQLLLIQKGYRINGGADGIYGTSTLGAVIDFQGKKRLKQDGVIGPATWAELVK